ncbi:DinB family protein [Larkinella sp. VNQ87]|uniref:DinB family protein n=1 Tax=Larkinella sp. VNQ87 TaxID=3400921 RepID=UPI003BFD2657
MKYGYDHLHQPYRESLAQLRRYIKTLPDQIREFNDDELTAHAPGKWSRKEILGHLIDSALNNLKRFTDAQFQPAPFPILRYNQAQSVVYNRYQELPTEHLLTLWQALNQQIVYVTESIPEAVLQQPVLPPDAAETVPLSWLIIDYVAHITHHVKQFEFKSL